MKRIFTAAVAALLTMFISTNVFAHSHLGGSKPADGDVVTEPLNEIVLEFDGQIEEGSFIDLTTTEGQAVEIQEFIIGDGTLTGTLAEPLANDEYLANWSIISADGHPLEGEFSFTVNAAVPDSVEEEAEEPGETETVEDEKTTESAEQSTEEETSASASEVEEDPSSMTVTLIVLLVVIAAVGFFLLSKRKK
ncbi:copper resistance protein [Oceanobacillus sp. 143]|uniref:Copper resistance protein n=1 Tax=Oceanobacillus zhaokaii TaxID=2052660 RepID=A0A345PLR7_9BACI|nr:copper resistance protein CopC [Oceanobacillus zhaokaii]AXI10947.1 copper resistance protein [Oceanobacillus zhaokaii]QGS69780.1 copper resistance protein [Oceanobacillus sp. 143]